MAVTWPLGRRRKTCEPRAEIVLKDQGSPSTFAGLEGSGGDGGVK